MGKQGKARAWENRKGRGKGGNPRVESRGAKANTADGGGFGERGPKETVARDPTPGVCPPPPPVIVSAPHELTQ